MECRYSNLNTEEKKKEFFLINRDHFNEDRPQLNDIETATLFFFLNRTCFNGLYRVNKKGFFNVPFGRYKSPIICDEKTILCDSELLKKVEILNGDFEESYQKTKRNVLYYFDPPYRPLSETSNFNDYSKEKFNDSEQIRLKLFCDKINAAGQYFLLSNSDGGKLGNKFFDDLFSDYKIEHLIASRNINANGSGRGKITEILIHNN